MRATTVHHDPVRDKERRETLMSCSLIPKSIPVTPSDMLDFYATYVLDIPRNRHIGHHARTAFYVTRETAALMLELTPDSVKFVPNSTPTRLRLNRCHTFYIDDTLGELEVRRDCTYTLQSDYELC